MARRAAPVPDDLPESDQLEGFPHPRATGHITGHRDVMAEVAAAIESGRMHHAWLLSGPKGIGKATLAYRIARTLLKHGTGVAVPEDLAVAEDERVFYWLKALSHPDFFLLRRPADSTGKIQTIIPIEEVRKAADSFAMSAGEGGWRVCIIDSVDDMNISAANALLKNLEEPPQRSVFLLISHSPGRLLPTIRSRCRKLAISPLSDNDLRQVISAHFPNMGAEKIALAAKLGEGSPGRALALAQEGGVDIYRTLMEHLVALPKLDLAALHRLGDSLARESSGQTYDVMMQMLLSWLAQMVRAGAAATPPQDRIAGEGALMQRLLAAAPLDQWTDVWENSGQLLRRADSVYLSRKQVLLSIFSSLAETAQGR